MGNFYEIDELLNEAIMTGVPSIIVEGIDDIAIYSKIFEQLPFDVEIYPIESLEGYSEGCVEVINAIEFLNGIESNRHDLKKHILGIVDKDVRDFRDEIPSAQPILMLNYYSIESHFFSLSSIHACIDKLSRVSRDLISERLCSDIFSRIENRLYELFYFSLESLKAATDPGYSAIFYYSYPSGRMKDEVIKSELEQRKMFLDNFAGSLGLNFSINTLRKIAKGKWLIDVFAEELLKEMKMLRTLCRQQEIKTCKVCFTNEHGKCLYRLKDEVNRSVVKHIALSDVSGPELEYIIERVSAIKP